MANQFWIGLLVICVPQLALAAAPCETDMAGELVCADGDWMCLDDSRVRVCVDEAGGNNACLLGVTCLLGSPLCNSFGSIQSCDPDDTCHVDADGRLLCPSGESSCTFAAGLYTCNESGEATVGVSTGEGSGSGAGSGGGSGDSSGGGSGGNPDDGGGWSSEDPSTEPDEAALYATGGGCSTSSGHASLPLLMMLIALVARRRRATLTCAAMCLAAAGSRADADGINANTLRSNVIGEGGIAVPDSETLDPYVVRIGALGGFSRNPLELRDGTDQRVMGVIDHLTTLDLRASVGLPYDTEISVLAPFILDRGGSSDIGSSRIGDLGVAGKWSAHRGRYGLAVMPEVIVPTGSDAFVSDNAWSAIARVGGDARIGDVRLGAIAGFRLRSGDVAYAGASTGDQLVWGGLVDWAVMAERGVHIVGEVHGARALGDAVRADPAELLGEIRWSKQNWIVLMGGGAGLTSSVGVPDWRAFVGVAFTMGSSSPSPVAPPTRIAESAVPSAPPPITPVAPSEPVPAATEPAPGPVIATEEPTKPAFIFEVDKPLVLHNIQFATGKSRLLASSFPLLDEIADSLQAQPSVRLRIEGHTDSRGNDRVNFVLSQQRALAVMNYLVGAGIDPARLDYHGYGPSRPVAPNDSAPNMAKNRRVELRTLTTTQEAGQ